MVRIEQIKAARAILGIRQDELAKKAGISTGTLNNIERGVQTDPKVSTILAIQNALEAEGIEFIEQEGDIGIRLNKRSQENAPVTLLVIDDSQSDRRLYKAWLSKLTDREYNIIEAGSAKDGYEAFLNHNPACILLDFMMYGKNGFQLLVEMRKEHLKIPPIIFLSATYDGNVKKDILAMGVEYLDKKTLTLQVLHQALVKSLN